MNTLMFDAVKNGTAGVIVDSKSFDTSEHLAATIVQRLEALWQDEQEETPESTGLFVQLCELVGEQSAFDRIAHFAS